MSGLEIVALIPACIGAYTAIAAEYRQWRKSRAERKSKKNMQLQKTLAKSGLKLEAEFEDRRRRLGHIFEKGDGKPEPLSCFPLSLASPPFSPSPHSTPAFASVWEATAAPLPASLFNIF